MTVLNAKGLDRFIESFDENVSTAEVLMDHKGIAVVEPQGGVRIYDVTPRYTMYIDGGHLDVDDLEVIECCFTYDHNESAAYPFNLFAYAESQNVQITLDTLFHQLWLSGPDIESIARVVLHPSFPKDATPVQP